MNRALAATPVLALALAAAGPGSGSAALVLVQDAPARRAVGPARAPAPLVVELESLAAVPSAGEAVVQPMAGFGPGWGNDAQLFWRPPAPVQEPIRSYPHLSLLFDVPLAGDYDLTLQHTLAPDYGQFTVLVAGRKAADVDGYGPAVQVARRALGRSRLTAGANSIVFTVFGKAAAATGYIVGLDRLEVVPAPAVPPPAPARRGGGAAAIARPRPEASSPAAAMPVGEGATARAADPAVVTHLIGENHRPRLEARSWGVAGRRGIEVRYEPRRLRLDWDRQNLVVGFRWLDPAGAPGGRWQIYDDIPPPKGQARPIASGSLPPIAAGEWQGFERDLMPYRPADPLKLLRDLPFGGTFDPGKMQPRLFVQVQPTSAAGVPVGEPSNFVEVKFSAEPMGKLKKPEPALTVALVSFKPVKPYDQRFLCWAVATRDGPPFAFTGEPLFKKGQKRGDLCDHESSSFLEGFAGALASAFGSFLELVESGIDQVSRLYADVKGGVLDLAAGPLTAIGCEVCRDGLALGLDAALASVGVPPSLPNFDEVMKGLEEGSIDAMTDSLVEAAVSQGLPVDQIPLAKDAARAAVEHLVSEAEQAVASRGSTGGSSGGWAPDLSRAYSPAVLVFEIRNRGPVRSKPMNLQIVNEEPDTVELELPTLPLSPRQTVPLGGYGPAWLPVPSLEPGTSIRVAVTLTPETDPHLWLDLVYGRSSLLPPQEACYRDYGENTPNGDPQKFAACQGRMKILSDLLYVTPYALNRAWADAYGKGADRFRLRLFRFGDLGNTEGVEATLTLDPGGASWVEYPEPTWLGRRLDQCVGQGGACGEPAAQAFCKRLGYPLASGAQGARDVGPTVRLEDGSFCNEPGCAGFAGITCSNVVIAGVIQP